MPLEIKDAIKETFQNLDVTKTYQIPNNESIQKNWVENQDYTDEQTAMLLANEPYVIGTAGAGCGKTHTLVGRLNYLNQLGLKSEQILNLSFSNAAVDNLANRFNDAKVATLASLCQNLYRLNFSAIEFNFYPYTFFNKLASLNINQKQFKQYQHQIEKSVEFTDVLNVKQDLVDIYFQHLYGRFDERTSEGQFVDALFRLASDNLFELQMLMMLNQQVDTTLSEIMMALKFMQPNTIIEMPGDIAQTKIITLDECQDTSSMEMLILLNLAIKLNAQIFMIGDANQALYEWRSANPEFIGRLETLTSFKTYHLTKNFRSKQAILTYANHILKHVKVGQASSIQLKTPNQETLTLSNFENVVTNSVNNKLDDDTTIDWCQEQLSKGRQVAVLASGHQIGVNMLDILKRQLSPILGRELTTMDLTNKRATIIDYVSALVHASMTNLKEFVQKSHNNDQLEKEYLEYLQAVIFNHRIYSSDYKADNSKYLKFLDSVMDYIHKQTHVDKLNQELNTHQISQLDWVYKYNDLLIEAEIKYNDYKQSIQDEINAKKQLANAKNYDMVMSTIHSAKGLEFDSCLIIYDQSNFFYRDGINQEKLRIFGVATTRAKETEHVLNVVYEDPKQNQKPVKFADFDAMVTAKKQYQLSDYSFKAQPLWHAYAETEHNLSN